MGVGNRLYVAAEGGQLYRSDDRGASWRALPSPYEGSFFGLLPIRGEGLLAFGLRGHLYKSADAGETFRLTQQDDRKGLSAVLPGTAGTVIVAGEGGVRSLPVVTEAP